MRTVFLAVAVLALGQETNQAEKLFRSAEKMLADAESVQLSMESTLKASKGESKVKGTMLLAKGNKARVEVSGEFFGKPFKMEMVSDGTKMKTETTPAKGGAVKDTPKNFNINMAGMVSRAGILGGLFAARPQRPGQKDPELDEILKISGFALGKKEKLGDRQVQVIDYEVMLDNDTAMTAQVWLDSETRLPLKRVLSAKAGKAEFRITETYQIRVNGKIDGKRFELPK